jgi:NAD(P)-dependent dehydrogenase (short-subunit alcohol dehydrogenase family)
MQRTGSAEIVVAVADLFRLDGRIVLVSGASSPIGAAACEALAEAGATVACAARNERKGRAVADRISTNGGSAFYLPLDLASEKSIREVHAAAVAQAGIIDILVHNAISQFPGHVERYSRADWEASMAVDATGYFQMTQLCLNDMLKKGGGNIITIASILGVVSYDKRLYPKRGGLDSFRPNYSYVKAGVAGFTRFIAGNYAEHNIRANCLSPGGIDTEETHPDEAPFAARTPMGRFAQPEEMKGPILFLASNASSYMTGQNLVVDGGYTIL